MYNHVIPVPPNIITLRATVRQKLLIGRNQNKKPTTVITSYPLVMSGCHMDDYLLDIPFIYG